MSKPKPLAARTAQTLVGMSQSFRKRLREGIFCGGLVPPFMQGADSVSAGLRIGERLRPCLGCSWCGQDPGDLPDDKWTECDGSGVLPARKANARAR